MECLEAEHEAARRGYRTGGHGMGGRRGRWTCGRFCMHCCVVRRPGQSASLRADGTEQEQEAAGQPVPTPMRCAQGLTAVQAVSISAVGWVRAAGAAAHRSSPPRRSATVRTEVRAVGNVVAAWRSAPAVERHTLAPGKTLRTVAQEGTVLHGMAVRATYGVNRCGCLCAGAAGRGGLPPRPIGYRRWRGRSPGGSVTNSQRLSQF